MHIGNKQTILAVDDTLANIDVVKGVLAQDYLVQAALNGKMALKIIEKQKPDLILLDEPTNHINFRHLPIIAQALDKYQGAMILVSHVPEFVSQIRIDQTLDLDSLKTKKKKGK